MIVGNGGNDVAKQADREAAPGTIGSRLNEIRERDGADLSSLFKKMQAGD